MKIVDPLEKTLLEIEERHELVYFFQELVNPDSTVPKVFLLHRQDLFPGFEQMDLVFPLVFWINREFKKTTTETTDAISLAKRFDDIKTAYSRETFSAILSWAKNQFGPVLSSVLAQNPELAQHIIQSGFQEKKEKQEKAEIKMPEEFDPEEYAEQMKESINLLIQEIRGHPLKYFEALTTVFPDPYLSLHLESKRIISDILKNSKATFQNYQKVIDLMFNLELIKNLETSFWCPKCPESIVLKSKSKLGPKSLDLKCPKCNKKMSISSIYKLDDFLWKLISRKDGLLGIAIAWLLRRRGVEYTSPVFVKETEMDFLCNIHTGKVLLECKMHRAPPTVRSVRQKLVDDLKQLNDHVKKYEKEHDEKLSQSYIVYNFDLSGYENLVNEEIEKYAKAFVIDFTELDEVISSFSAKAD